MNDLYAVHFDDEDGARIAPPEGDQRVYADSPRAAMIEAGAMLAVHAPAVAVVRKVTR